MLDPSECERARVARDRQYDGRFFTGVRTTKVYCRPVCPVRPAQAKSVTFFPSAAAAEAAGFRPCLRCRPETAPFSPAWKGTRTTVERELRMIQGGALDEGSVEALAARLGIGARHLGRLFQKHIGASRCKSPRRPGFSVPSACSTRPICRWQRSRCGPGLGACVASMPCSQRSTNVPRWRSVEPCEALDGRPAP